MAKSERLKESDEALGQWVRELINSDENPIPKVIYKLLELADIDTGDEIGRYLNDIGHASLTVCPNCHSDDFIHVEGCEFDNDNPYKEK